MDKLYIVTHLYGDERSMTIINGIEKVVKFLHDIIDDVDEEDPEKIEEYKVNCSKELILKGIEEHYANEFAQSIDYEDDDEWVKVEEISDESMKNLKEYFTWK